MVFFMKIIYHRRIFKVWCIKIHTLILKFLLNFNKICLFSEEFQRFSKQKVINFKIIKKYFFLHFLFKITKDAI